jgi:glycosyltransferase involved in cell wall biosynthesis
MGQFVDSLAATFVHVDLVGPSFLEDHPVSETLARRHEYGIASPNVTCVPVGQSSPRTPLFRKATIALQRIPGTFAAIKEADFVYIMLSGYAGIIAHLLCRFLRKPYALYFGSDWQEVARFSANWRSPNSLLYRVYVQCSKWAEKFAVRGSRFTIAHGKRVVDKFSGLNVPVVNTAPMVLIKDHHFFRREDTCQGEIITYICVGTLAPRKGQHRLIDACYRLLQQGLPVKLLLVGAGDLAYEAKLRQQVEQCGMENSVEFAGHINDLEKLLALYRQADIFVLPTQGEGFPRVIYEAMSQGLPVIASKIGTLQAELTDHGQALLVDTASVDELACAITTVAEDSTLRRKLIQNGYRFSSARLANDGTASQVISLYKQYVKQ